MYMITTFILRVTLGGGVIQSDRGIRQKKRTKRIHTELQTRLKYLCQDRLQGRKSIAEFLRGVSLNIRGGQPHI